MDELKLRCSPIKNVKVNFLDDVNCTHSFDIFTHHKVDVYGAMSTL